MAVADISTIQNQLAIFQSYNSRLPTTAEGLSVLVNNPGNTPDWPHPYWNSFPLDPWQHPYVYQHPGKNGQPFDLFSCGPDGIAGNADDIH